MIIFGLGNPGKEYLNNRHNVGFMFVDYLHQNLEVVKSFQYDKYSNAEIAKVKATWQNKDKMKDLIIVKPQTFMNRSGFSVKHILGKYPDKKPEDICVAHDDLDILLGDFKISLGKGPKQHNGIISIQKSIGTPLFLRIRLGIENRGGKEITGENYVLSDFSNSELETLKTKVFPLALERVSDLITNM